MLSLFYKKLILLHKNCYKVLTRMDKNQPVYLVIDIETCGIDKSIFSIGVALFQIVDKQMIMIEEKLFSYSPVLPTSEIIDGEDGPEERIKYNDFTISCWDSLWSKNIEFLEFISIHSAFKDEKELLDEFYLWWIKTTKKHHKLSIISDNVAIDIGYMDARILKNRSLGSSKRPLIYQWREKKWFYVAPIDIFSIEHIILSGENGQQCLETVYQNCPINENNPVENAKKIGWQFTQLMTYF